MTEDKGDGILQLEREKIELEHYKANLDYKKFVMGSVFAAISIAAIPPLFQLGTAALEYVKSNADRQAKQQAFRDDYIKEFVSNALNQDIELRIRFAQYFAKVSTEPYREDWIDYLNELYSAREQIRSRIDNLESEWSNEISSQHRDVVAIARLERNLAWAYKEVGYVEQNRSAAGNPRATESNSSPIATVNPLSLSRFADSTYYLTQPLIWTPRPELQGKYAAVTVPAGFVVTFESIPRVAWGLLEPGSAMAQASIIHEYLYWMQSTSRAESDETFKTVMQDYAVDTRQAALIYQAIKFGGKTIWENNAKLKNEGERRILKEFPSSPSIRWDEWKKRPNVFID